MSNSSCKHEGAPSGAKFCPECGEPLSDASRQSEVQVQISQQAEHVEKGGLTALEVAKIQGSVTVVQGDIFHIENPTTEQLQELSNVKAVSTELKPDKVRTDKDRRDIPECDDLLSTDSEEGYQSAPDTPYTPSLNQMNTQQPQFQPVGNWQARLSDGSTMIFQLLPNGMLQGEQQAGMLSMRVNFGGQWAFDPYRNILQLQGIVAGFNPFVLQIAIQKQEGNIYFGFGSDECQYILMSV